MKTFGFNNNRNIFTSLGNILDKGGYILLSVIGTILVTLGGAFISNYDFPQNWKNSSGILEHFKLIIFNPYSAFILGSPALFLGTIGTYKDQKEQQKAIEKLTPLKSKLEYAEEELQDFHSKINKLNEESVEIWLKLCFKNSVLDSSERISIYYEKNDEFYILSRYSKNPLYKKVHKQKFSLDKGVISKAWENGSYQIELPDYEKENKPYLDRCKELFNYKTEDIEPLTMKSRQYFAKAITDADIHIGVIVFESIKSNIFSDKKIENISKFLDDSASLLAKFVRDSRDFDRELVLKSRREAKMGDVEEDFLSSFSQIRGGGHE
ncbi:hypothetical protein [Xenorhabdus bovienii]|uniref:hypothetical protein n=1 Tax=Xenorhabdus bovienii TaxID=40576 RepID=UPI00237D07F2|nr:hypothetical protein [Xenorhabdus bovienii]MDE1482353.1 hypothetical protein [Xenorhabdus bovienii]MDE9441703.1 hypothetical protein [Xenorhabdus bovienii]MDE9457795.1 hypothetical protein [Xenorhabdus bovienii]MDE9461329.1 hypothetical protein [Xenorhabdus bovienii]MDE9469634.1 hypothetical protein [Xenorhabdus bovienii]